MGQPLRIVIIEDEPLFRDLLARAFDQSDEFDVHKTFGDGESAIVEFEQLQVGTGPFPDVAMVDVQLSGALNGLQTAFQLRTLQPELGVLFLSNHRMPSFLSPLDAFDKRGFSYLLKSAVTDFDTLRRAIIGTAEGAVVIDKSLLKEGVAPQGRLAELTERQLQVLDLVAQGYSNTAVAAELYLSPRTVENHLARIYQLLGIDDNDEIQPRVQAVVAYLSERFPRHLGHLVKPLKR